MKPAPPVTRMRTAERAPRSAGTDGTDGSFTSGSSVRDQCCRGGASFPRPSGSAFYGPVDPPAGERPPLARAGRPDVRIPVTRPDPREPEQPELPARLDPRAGSGRTPTSSS